MLWWLLLYTPAEFPVLEAYLEPSQISTIERFSEIVNGFNYFR